jgi:hypothetical protein
MKDRIEINGIWYVKEKPDSFSPIELDPVEFEGVVVENDYFCFEATRICRDNGGHYGLDIKFTDKRIKPFKEDYWDNDSWMKGILNNNPDSLKELPDIGSDGIRFLQAFLQFLKDEEWL